MLVVARRTSDTPDLPRAAGVEAVQSFVPRRTSAADFHDPRAEGFALLDRIQAMRHEQPAGWSGDLDALESLVWRMLFLDEQD